MNATDLDMLAAFALFGPSLIVKKAKLFAEAEMSATMLSMSRKMVEDNNISSDHLQKARQDLGLESLYAKPPKHRNRNPQRKRRRKKSPTP